MRSSGCGAEVLAIGDAPDGSNINVGCGATDLTLLQKTVVDGGFDLGIAFDGDGDRMLAVDENGEPVDGDQIIAILALDQKVDTVAVTVMTNLGFHALMREHGIRVVTTDVGDRYVLEALQREGALLGGEQSGHVIYLRDHVTGDGLAAGLAALRGAQGSSAERDRRGDESIPAGEGERSRGQPRADSGDRRGGRASEPGMGRRRACARPTLGHGAADSGAGGGP